MLVVELWLWLTAVLGGLFVVVVLVQTAARGIARVLRRRPAVSAPVRTLPAR